MSSHRPSFNTWPSNSLIRKTLLNFSWVKCLRVLLLHTYSYISLSLSPPAHRGRCEINFRVTGGRQRHISPLSPRPLSAGHLFQLTLSPRSTSTCPQPLQEGCAWLQRRQWHPTPVLLPGNSHGWRSLVGYSPWGRYESDTIEQLHFHFSLSCLEEGNGNPLQCSCLENPRQELPRDRRAWWAAVYGIAQSRTRLK